MIKSLRLDPFTQMLAYNQLPTNQGANMEADMQGLMADILLGMWQNFTAAGTANTERRMTEECITIMML